MTDIFKRLAAWRFDLLGGEQFSVVYAIYILAVCAVCMADAWWDWPWE